MSTFTNTDSTIDSRDIIERIEELENELESLSEQEKENDIINTAEKVTDYYHDLHCELETLKALAEECEQYSDDWEYGSTLIHRDYFETYMDEMVADCYELPKDIPYWMSVTYDYDALEQDYTSVDFNGEEYLIR